ncbi:MAG: N-formylglutamate amidohydrolase [Alphaproteobacteria bacterium]
MPDIPQRAFARTAPLIAADEPPPFEAINTQGPAPLLFVCDHASRAIPRVLGSLGLDEAARRGHVAWDIGAGEVTRRLSARFGAPALLANYSRLAIDLNRALDDPTSIALISDGVIIPGNRNLMPDAVEARAEALFRPYHSAVEQALARFCGRGVTPAFVSVHSFSPVYRKETRPWHIGILWDRDPRMALPFMEKFINGWDVCIGDNLPYSGRDHYAYTVDCHAARAGLPHLAMEIRHDLVATRKGVALWSERIGNVLAEMLADPGLRQVEQFE